jgi:CheY-like chemotaxis protein
MSTAAQRPHILLVDDSPGIRDAIRLLLEDEGYRVSAADEPLDPAALIELAPDVVIQELRFHRSLEAGWSALTQMQLSPELARVPVILCTTESGRVQDPGMAANLDRLGVQVVLKPFVIEDLLTAVAEALTARTLLDQVRQDQGAELPTRSKSPGVGNTCTA